MDYIRIAPDIDSDPDIEAAGWVGARVYELLLKVVALKDFRGRIPAECQTPRWLARRWNLNPEDLPGIDVETFIAGGIRRLEAVGLVRMDGTELVVRGWEKFYNPPKSGAERQASYKARKRAGDAGDAPTSPVTQVTEGRHSDATPHHTTPLHVTTPPPPDPSDVAVAPSSPEPTKAAAAEKKGWKGSYSANDFWGFAQTSRQLERRWTPEDKPPKNLAEWFAEAMASDDVGGEAWRLKAAYVSYLHDRNVGKNSAIPKPFGLFQQRNVYGWRAREAQREEPAAPAPEKPKPGPCVLCGEGGHETRADRWLCVVHLMAFHDLAPGRPRPSDEQVAQFFAQGPPAPTEPAPLAANAH